MVSDVEDMMDLYRFWKADRRLMPTCYRVQGYSEFHFGRMIILLM